MKCVTAIKEKILRFKKILNDTAAKCEIPDNLLREFAKCEQLERNRESRMGS